MAQQQQQQQHRCTRQAPADISCSVCTAVTAAAVGRIDANCFLWIFFSFDVSFWTMVYHFVSAEAFILRYAEGILCWLFLFFWGLAEIETLTRTVMDATAVRYTFFRRYDISRCRRSFGDRPHP